MSDVTVPPEIVEKAAKASWSRTMEKFDPPLGWDRMGDAVRTMLCDRAEEIIAAVYGDIVEAARRDALAAAAEAIEREPVLHDALPAINGYWDGHASGLRDAARIVAGLRDQNAPSDALRASVSVRQGESGSTPVRDGSGPQIAAEGFEAAT